MSAADRLARTAEADRLCAAALHGVTGRDESDPLPGVALVAVGAWSALGIPIDAVPDITSPQVQINTEVSALAPDEIETLVTLPIETEMAGLPGMQELRSLSKFGLSQVTMTFTYEVEGATKPSCVAQVIFRYYE